MSLPSLFLYHSGRRIRIKSGPYFLIRSEKDFQEIRENFRAAFSWEKIDDATRTHPLYLLKEGNFPDEGTTAGVTRISRATVCLSWQ